MDTYKRFLHIVNAHIQLHQYNKLMNMVSAIKIQNDLTPSQKQYILNKIDAYRFNLCSAWSTGNQTLFSTHKDEINDRAYKLCVCRYMFYIKDRNRKNSLLYKALHMIKSDFYHVSQAQSEYLQSEILNHIYSEK